MEAGAMTARGEKCLRDRSSLNSHNAPLTEKPFTSNPCNFHIHFSQYWHGPVTRGARVMAPQGLHNLLKLTDICKNKW